MRTLMGALLCASLMMTGAQAAGNVGAGRALAVDACSACHQVTARQKTPPPVFNPEEGVDVAAPSFPVIAKKYARRPSALRHIILSPPHPMREQLWDRADLAAVVAFIQSLRVPVPRHAR